MSLSTARSQLLTRTTSVRVDSFLKGERSDRASQKGKSPAIAESQLVSILSCLPGNLNELSNDYHLKKTQYDKLKDKDTPEAALIKRERCEAFHRLACASFREIKQIIRDNHHPETVFNRTTEKRDRSQRIIQRVSQSVPAAVYSKINSPSSSLAIYTNVNEAKEECRKIPKNKPAIRNCLSRAKIEIPRFHNSWMRRAAYYDIAKIEIRANCFDDAKKTLELAKNEVKESPELTQINIDLLRLLLSENDEILKKIIQIIENVESEINQYNKDELVKKISSLIPRNCDSYLSADERERIYGFKFSRKDGVLYIVDKLLNQGETSQIYIDPLRLLLNENDEIFQKIIQILENAKNIDQSSKNELVKKITELLITMKNYDADLNAGEKESIHRLLNHPILKCTRKDGILYIINQLLKQIEIKRTFESHRKEGIQKITRLEKKLIREKQSLTLKNQTSQEPYLKFLGSATSRKINKTMNRIKAEKKLIVKINNPPFPIDAKVQYLLQFYLFEMMFSPLIAFDSFQKIEHFVNRISSQTVKVFNLRKINEFKLESLTHFSIDSRIFDHILLSINEIKKKILEFNDYYSKFRVDPTLRTTIFEKTHEFNHDMRKKYSIHLNVFNHIHTRINEIKTKINYLEVYSKQFNINQNVLRKLLQAN